MLRISRTQISTAIVAIFSCACVFALPQASRSTLAGIVLDGKIPVSGARITLTQAGSSTADQASTDAEGKFSVLTAKSGDCVLRVHKDGYRDSELPVTLPLATGTPLRISLARASANKQSDEGMQFSDKSDFTVAGITDWTAAGGHGSDVNLRASESLARQTRMLGEKGASYHPSDLPSLEQSHQLNPTDYQTSYRLAEAYDGAGQYNKARALINDLLAKDDRAELHRLLGDALEHSNNPLAAEHEYERAVQLQPSEENYFAWGIELLQHRAVEAAIDVFTKGARLFPRSERMFAALGAALYAHGAYEQGAQRVCDASDLNPSDLQPYLFLGKMQQASPRPLPCVTEKLARFAHTQPDNAWANYYYALALLSPDEKSRAKEAEALLKNAIRLDPKFAQAYLQLGVLQAERDDRQSARISFENAASSDPTFPDPHFRLAQLYRRTGDQQKASQELQTFERLKQSDAAAVEQRRREIRQFVVVMKDAPPPPAN